jgi:hypothetical protein
LTHCAAKTVATTDLGGETRMPMVALEGDWARDDRSPRARAGWKHWAVVLPELIIGKMNMQLFTTRCSRAGMTVRVFSDRDDALEWLKHPIVVQPSAPADRQG